MKIRLLFVLIAAQVSMTCLAAETPSYSSFTIKPALTKGANAVTRIEETLFTVHSNKSATEKVKRAVTVLNADGKSHALLVVNYDKLHKVDFIKGAVYDMVGKKVKVLKSADIKDYSATDDGTLFGDNRVKVVELTHTSYPYTVEIEYQTTSHNMLFYTGWYPITAEKSSVEKSSFQVVMAPGMDLRYYEQRLPEKVSIDQIGGQKVYRWSVQDLTPIEQESYGPKYRELLPMVLTAPKTFEVEGYAGSMDSWKAIGEWQNKVNVGRDVLPDATKAKILALTKNLPTQEEKIKAVYQYMQNKTRYVSIQLGLGGWQPFEAGLVDSKGYGDCKALSNYTKALLEAAGIKSHYAIIYGGDDNRPVIPEFPSMTQFNHVVLCVPTAKDTVWLECTSQMDDAGYTGSNTGDRYSLIVTPDGGKLVHTPKFSSFDNTQIRSAKVKLTAQGGGICNVVTQYTGRQHEPYSDAIHSQDPEKQKKWLYRQISIPAFDIKSFAFEKVKGQPQVTETLQLDLPKVASVSGKRIFITPNLMNRTTSVPPTLENRKNEVIFSYPYHDVDSVEFEIPSGYKAESIPQPVKFSSAFGEYQAQVQLKGNKLLYVRQMTMHRSRHEAAKYMELVDFLKQVSRADQQQVVLAADAI